MFLSLSFCQKEKEKKARGREREEKQKLSSLLETNQLDFFLLFLSLSRLSSLRILSFSASQQQRTEGARARLDPSCRKELPLSILSTFILHFFFEALPTALVQRILSRRQPVSFHAANIPRLTRTRRRCLANVVSCRYHPSHLDSAT